MIFVTQLIIALPVKRPFLFLAFLIPIVIASFFGVFRINYEDGLRSLFASDSTAAQNYAVHASRFVQNETDIAILVTAKNGFSSGELAHLQEFLLEVQFLDGINGVFSVFSLRKGIASQGALSPVLPSDLTDTEKVQRALISVTAKTQSGIALISQDLRETVVVLSLADDLQIAGGASRVMHNLQELADTTSADTGLQFGVTGLLSVREHIVQGLRLDQMQINLLGAVLGLAVSLAIFRSFWVAALNTVTPLAAMLFCLGAFGWLGLSINALTNALPVLILVLASSDSIHITYEIRRRVANGEGEVAAIRHAIADIAPPCVLTSLTTILAFSSLLYSDSPIIRNLALSGGAGVFIALLAVLFIHPLAFVLGSRLAIIRRALPQSANARGHQFTTRIFQSIAARFRVVAMIGIALCAFTLWVMLPVQTSYRFMENVDESQPVAQVLARVERISGPITNINLPVHLNDGIALGDPAILSDLNVLQANLESLSGVRSVVSAANALNRFSGGGELVQTSGLTETLALLPPRVRNLMISQDRRTLQILLMVPDEGSQGVSELVTDISVAPLDLPLSAVTVGSPTGFLVMTSALSGHMIGQLTISFLIAALICPALIGLWFKRLDFGLAAVVPNILPIAFIGAFLTWIDLDIQLTSALALTIAFGIALDDSIHVFNRLHLQARQKNTGLTGPVVTRGMAHISPVLITTTMILSSGILATLVSDMPMIRFFGVLCIATFILALICDLLLLPAIVTWVGAFQRKTS